MHDEPRSRRDVESDLAEMLSGEAMVVGGCCGPSLLMLHDPESGGSSNDMMIVQPMPNYDELGLQIAWKMADPTHLARLELVKTLEWDAKLEDPEAWHPMLDQYDRKRSTFIVPPNEWAAENRLVLRYADVHCHSIGVTLRARSKTGPIPPWGARMYARIWSLLIRGTPERRGAQTCYVPPIRIGDDVYRIPAHVVPSIDELKVEDGRIWGKVADSKEWADITSWCQVQAKFVDPLADDCISCYGEGLDAEGKKCEACGGSGKGGAR
jgi:hypothetical protein